MDFVTCIKRIVKEFGTERIAHRSFIGILEDYHAFENVEPSFKFVLKHWSENGTLVKISRMSANDSQWKIDVSNIIYQTETDGFKKEASSDLLHKLLLGMGVVGSSFDWDKEFLPNKTINVPQSTKQQKIEEEKALRGERERKRQEEIAQREQREKERERRKQEKTALRKKRKQEIKKDFLSIYEPAIVVLFIAECIIFAVSLIIIIIGWVNGMGHAPVWTCLLWESLAFGLPSGIYVSEGL